MWFGLQSYPKVGIFAAKTTRMPPITETSLSQQKKSRTIGVEKTACSHRGKHSIYLPVSESEYLSVIEDATKFRNFVSKYMYEYPELFPCAITGGYTLHDRDISKKMNLTIRRICIKKTGAVYGIYPSFVLPYLVGKADETVSNALLLLSCGVPYWLVTKLCGKNDSYWERIECSLGRNSIVGTTVRNASSLPEHYAADEKHTQWNDQRVYVAMTASEECIFGISVSKTADADGLMSAYGVFKEETQQVDAKFAPKSVNTDAWAATCKVWKDMFQSIILILCFLHSVLKIRNIATKKDAHVDQIVSQMWEAYRADNEVAFCDTLFDLQDWAKKNVSNTKIVGAIDKVVGKVGNFANGYVYKDGYRTSNTVDRPMNVLDRCLFHRQSFHGHLQTTENKLRAWAILYNFRPFCARTSKYKNKNQLSRAEQLNAHRYSNNWLQNMLVFASMNGFRHNHTIH